ncbi:WD40-repeat-containing domain protein [Obelidium mucronatum]|nr:WD40-repeat-containing domain protein [Obelidium mucronatum]
MDYSATLNWHEHPDRNQLQKKSKDEETVQPSVIGSLSANSGLHQNPKGQQLLDTDLKSPTGTLTSTAGAIFLNSLIQPDLLSKLNAATLEFTNCSKSNWIWFENAGMNMSLGLPFHRNRFWRESIRIAETHPILKITWLVISAGFKIASATADEEKKFQDLAQRFLNASKEIDRLKSISTKGIPDAVVKLLVENINEYVECLIDVVELFLAHNAQTYPTSFFGKSNKVDQINSRLEKTQSSLAKVKSDGTFEIITAMAGNVIDTRTIASENLMETKKVLAAVEGMQAKILSVMENASSADTKSRDAADSELAILRSHCQFTEIHSASEIAALESKRNPNTRGWIIKQMVDAVLGEKDGGNKVVWLRGEAGTGKSVISGCVAADLEKKGLLAASFFCQHDNRLRDNVSALIQTLAYELARNYPDFRKHLVASLEDSKFKDKTRPSVKDILSNFIITPFREWRIETPFVIVIDALDELADHENVGLVLDTFQSLHAPIKLFITSRPDVSVSLKWKKQFEIESFDVESAANKEDIKIFTRERLTEMTQDLMDVTSHEFENMVELLSKSSNGLFIWITLVLGNVSGSDNFIVSEDGVMEVVEEVLGENEVELKETGKQLLERLEQSAALDLHALYCRALHKAFTTELSVADFKIVAGVVLTTKVPLSTDAICVLVSNFSASDKLAKIRITKTLKSLQSLIKIDRSGNHLLYTRLSTIIWNALIAIQIALTPKLVKCEILLTAVTTKLDHGTPQIGPAASLTVNMASLDCGTRFPSWPVNFLTEALEYSVLYWAYHFADCFANMTSFQQRELITSLHKFCTTKLPYYLEAMLLLGKLNEIFAATSLIQNRLQSTATSTDASETHEIRSLLMDLKFISFNFRAQLLMNPLQVYRHALIAVPQETQYFKRFHHLAPAKMVVGMEKQWGPFSLMGHFEDVTSVVLSQDGKTAVTGSSDRSIKIWSTETGECIQTFLGHTNSVLTVALSHDEKQIVSGSIDQTIKCWSIETGECLQTLVGHTANVGSVAVGRDGKTVVSGSWDNTIRIWDADTGECVRVIRGEDEFMRTSVALFGDGRHLVSGSWNGSVEIWSLETGKRVNSLNGHSAYVYCVAVSRDGKFIVSGSNDSTAKIWSTETGDCIQTLQGHKLGTIRSVKFSFDGETIVTGSDDKSIKLWSFSTGECIKTFEGHTSPVYSAAISNDGAIIASGSGDRSAKLWTVKSGHYTKSLESHVSPVSSVDLSADNSTIVSVSSDRKAKIWSLETGECVDTFHVNDPKFHFDYFDETEQLSVALVDGWLQIEREGKKDILFSLVGNRRGYVLNNNTLCWFKNSDVFAISGFQP